MTTKQVSTRTATTARGRFQRLRAENSTGTSAIPPRLRRFPTKPTWLRAVKNRQYASWPGLTPKAIAKHFPESEETLKVHGRKTKRGQRSTKRNPFDQGDWLSIASYTETTGLEEEQPSYAVQSATLFGIRP